MATPEESSTVELIRQHLLGDEGIWKCGNGYFSKYFYILKIIFDINTSK
jgi:hypothetical protein